jgi:hypothetical protein
MGDWFSPTVKESGCWSMKFGFRMWGKNETWCRNTICWSKSGKMKKWKEMQLEEMPD